MSELTILKIQASINLDNYRTTKRYGYLALAIAQTRIALSIVKH